MCFLKTNLLFKLLFEDNISNITSSYDRFIFCLINQYLR